MPAERTPLARRRFAFIDQHAFADVSGDINPLHMDPVYARQTQLGDAVVHGMHSTLWVMEALAKQGLLATWPEAMRVRFLRPVIVGEEAHLFADVKDNGNIRFEIGSRGETAVMGDLGTASSQEPVRIGANAHDREWPADLTHPHVVELSESGNPAGTIKRIDRSPRAAALFPALAAMMNGADKIQALASLSYLVGMISPGLNSIFGSLDCTFSNTHFERLRFEPDAVDLRFNRLVQRVDAGCLFGMIETFFRPPA